MNLFVCVSLCIGWHRPQNMEYTGWWWDYINHIKFAWFMIMSHIFLDITFTFPIIFHVWVHIEGFISFLCFTGRKIFFESSKIGNLCSQCCDDLIIKEERASSAIAITEKSCTVGPSMDADSRFHARFYH